MSEMVERLARAAFDVASQWDYDGRLEWDDLNDGMREQWRMMARAAIAAMREPTNDSVWYAGFEAGGASANDDWQNGLEDFAELIGKEPQEVWPNDVMCFIRDIMNANTALKLALAKKEKDGP